jgi:hypothetical protein
LYSNEKKEKHADRMDEAEGETVGAEMWTTGTTYKMWTTDTTYKM